VGSVLLWCGAVYLHRRRPLLAHRLLAPLPFGLLLLAMNCNQVIAAEALYLRAHKQEKFLMNSVVGAVLTGTSTYVLGRYCGALGVTAGYAILALVVGIGFGTWTFVKYRRRWHAE
jgi:O-antigen/teichoic acid export membrane protein